MRRREDQLWCQTELIHEDLYQKHDRNHRENGTMMQNHLAKVDNGSDVRVEGPRQPDGTKPRLKLIGCTVSAHFIEHPDI